MAVKRAIGIDLGTTFSCAAYVKSGKPQVIKSKLGYATIPSVVTVDDREEAVVGQPAERRMILEPQNTIYGSKRLLGRTYSQSAVDRFQPQFQYKLVADKEGFIAAEIFGRAIPLVEVSALILCEIRYAAERILGEKVSHAVITVPAYFNENQRALVREAGQMADINVMRIINEPTAAALAYNSSRPDGERLLIFDLGGGTFDVSIVEVKKSVYTVLAVDGDTFLGGLDVDYRLTDLVLARLSAKRRQPVELDSVNFLRLRSEAQKAKHELSVQHSALVQVTNLMLADGTSLDVHEKVTREELEEATRDLCDLTMSIVKKALGAAKLRCDQIDEVLLVGGQTRMPALHERLTSFFGFPPSKNVHPDEVVALGAAIAAGSGREFDALTLVDVLPMPIGIAEPDGSFHTVIPRNTAVPHTTTVKLMVQPGCPVLKLALFQGHHPKTIENEYLGTVVVDGLEAATTPVACVIQLHLDEESLLTVKATIAELGIEQKIKLATHYTTEDVAAQMQDDHIQIDVEVPDTDAVPPKKSPYTDNRGFRMMQEDAGWFRRMIDRIFRR
jgi:molecular chaperone DnaK